MPQRDFFVVPSENSPHQEQKEATEILYKTFESLLLFSPSCAQGYHRKGMIDLITIAFLIILIYIRKNLIGIFSKNE